MTSYGRTSRSLGAVSQDTRSQTPTVRKLLYLLPKEDPCPNQIEITNSATIADLHVAIKSRLGRTQDISIWLPTDAYIDEDVLRVFQSAEDV